MMEQEQKQSITMKSCVHIAAVLLGMDDVAEAIESGTSANEDTEKTLKLLVRCGNLVFGEVAAEYFPLKTTEKVLAKENKINYADLQKRVIDIFGVKRSKISEPFKLFYDGIVVKFNGECEVEYSYEPLALDLSGVSDYVGGKPSERCVAYGIACEYSLISGMTEEAALWDKRYKDSLAAATIEKKEKRVKRRAWI